MTNDRRQKLTAPPLNDCVLAEILRDPFIWTLAQGLMTHSDFEDQAEVRADDDADADAELHLFADMQSRETRSEWSFPEFPVDPARLAEFSRVAASIRADRATAADRVNRLLDMDPKTWRSAIAADASLRTAAVVEGILAAVNKTTHLTARCLELTALATEIASSVESDLPPILLAQIRGEAWREHAWALVNRGWYPSAEDAARCSLDYIQSYPTLATDAALAEYVLATAMFRRGASAEAAELAEKAARTFLDWGDMRRFVKARLLQGIGLFKAKRFAESVALWESLIQEVSTTDRATLAYLYNNIGGALRDLQDYERATWYLQQAMGIFEELGDQYATEVPRVRMAVARLLYQRARFDEALAEHHRARGAFAALQMGAGVAAVDLEIVEILLVTGRVAEAARLCRDLPRVFRNYGMEGNELEAGAFLMECAAMERLTVQNVVHVREYLRDLPAHPHLRFVKPTMGAGE
jgi:tetratricopeptide (TPR) repeat protein